MATNSPSLRAARGLLVRVDGGNTSVVRVNVPFSSPVTRNIMVRRTSLHSLSTNAAASGVFSVMGHVHPRVSTILTIVACVGPVFMCNAREFVTGYRRYKVSTIVIPSAPCRRGRRLASCDKGCNVSMVSLVTPASRREVGVVTGRTRNFICYISSVNIANMEDRVAASMNRVMELIGSMGSVPYTVNFNVSAPRRTGGVDRDTSNIVINSTVIGVVTGCNGSDVGPIYSCIGDVGRTVS